MNRYGDRHGDSGVVAYLAGPGSITVRFRDGCVYLYDDSNPGARHVAEMQRLATRGQGLNTYINKFVRGRYAARLE
jgi:hypothetical protein